MENAVKHYTIQTDIIEKSGEILNPRTINTKGEIQYIPTDDWCSGFFQEVCGTYMRLQMTQNGKN